ncbi:MAG: sugar nucleotide-binding protein [Prolixibacteraceae bacterium]|nr:sugar nucleotide-binding protein [Prolixibacteraceae bacterium]
MRTQISILGCGWLGTTLGKRLLTKRYIVKGSTTSNNNYNLLETTGIQPYYLNVTANSMDIDYANFFNTDILIISLPPKRIQNVEEVFTGQIKQIINYIKELKIPKVIFISSTSVYESANKPVKEDEVGNPEKLSGKALLKAEEMVKNIAGTKTAILRIAGMIGADRNPARFLLHKKEVSGDVPVNLVHRDDCVNIITEIIEKEIWGEIFNVCCTGHPTKREFYTKAAKVGNLPVPNFTEKKENFKIVDNSKLIDRLGYKFEYPDPMDYLKELEEWIYRI